MKLKYHVTSLWQANMGNDMKKILFTFDFHILPEQRNGGRIFPCHCISIKKTIPYEIRVDTFTYNRNCLQTVGLQ